jgi:prepilin-type N-terminal cleavage/methylation domain-containing protein
MKRARKQRGFTLIEVMMVAAILGVLSSVAVPTLLQFAARARKAERNVVMTAVARSAQDFLGRNGSLPVNPGIPWNPAPVPGLVKHQLDVNAGGWRDLQLKIDGSLYYRYTYNVNGATLNVVAEGDVDGDGVVATRIATYQVQNGILRLVGEVSDDDAGVL